MGSAVATHAVATHADTAPRARCPRQCLRHLRMWDSNGITASHSNAYWSMKSSRALKDQVLSTCSVSAGLRASARARTHAHAHAARCPMPDVRAHAETRRSGR